MNKIALLLLSVFTLTACPNSNPVTEKVHLKINIVGLDFISEETDSLKSAFLDVFSEFEHNYAYTDIYLYSDDAHYNISSGRIGQGVSTAISVGKYQVNGYGGYSSPLGIGELSFILPEQEAVVESGTANMNLNAIPDCGLILIADVFDQLKSAYLTGEGAKGLEFSESGHYRYTYFSPTAGFQAHIIKENDEEVVMDTKDLKTGRVYKFEILAQ